MKDYREFITEYLKSNYILGYEEKEEYLLVRYLNKDNNLKYATIDNTKENKSMLNNQMIEQTNSINPNKLNKKINTYKVFGTLSGIATILWTSILMANIGEINLFLGLIASIGLGIGTISNILTAKELNNDYKKIVKLKSSNNILKPIEGENLNYTSYKEKININSIDKMSYKELEQRIKIVEQLNNETEKVDYGMKLERKLK